MNLMMFQCIIITCADDAVGYGHLSAVGYVDPVGVGAPSRRGDEQPRDVCFPAVGDHYVHLHAVLHLEVVHYQMVAASEVQGLQILRTDEEHSVPE